MNQVGGGMKSSAALVAFSLLLASVLTLSHILLRAAAVYSPLEIPWLLRVGAALFLYAVVFFVYTTLLRRFDVSSLYPIYTALSVIGVFLAGVLFFNENITIYKVIGVILLVIGVKLISA